MSPAIYAVAQAPPPDPEPARDEWRDEKDLQAQRNMAQWAFWMVWVSFAGVGVGAIGIVYLAGTYNEAKKATAAAKQTIDETQRVGEAQVRAYLAYHDEFVFIEDNQITFNLQVNNIGQSPAKMFGIMDLCCEITTTVPEIKTFAAVEYEDSLAGAEVGQIAGPTDHVFKAQFRFSPEEIQDLKSRLTRTDVIVFVHGIFWYRDVFRKVMEDPFVYCGRFVSGARKSTKDFMIITSSTTSVVERAKKYRSQKNQD